MNLQGFAWILILSAHFFHSHTSAKTIEHLQQLYCSSILYMYKESGGTAWMHSQAWAFAVCIYALSHVLAQIMHMFYDNARLWKNK